jgi:hypothetical protein
VELKSVLPIVAVPGAAQVKKRLENSDSTVAVVLNLELKGRAEWHNLGGTGGRHCVAVSAVSETAITLASIEPVYSGNLEDTNE